MPSGLTCAPKPNYCPRNSYRVGNNCVRLPGLKRGNDLKIKNLFE